MGSPEIRSQTLVWQTRRVHKKSRTGCFECKRRRVKCDETKPSCMRCVLHLDNCIYPSASQPAIAKDRRDDLSLPSSASSAVSLSPNAPSFSDRSSWFETSTCSTPATVETNRSSTAVYAPQGLSDTDLYHHYLQHTSHTLSLCRKDQSALQIGMPTLALQSKTVFHSLLAVSAANLACDMISRNPSPEIGAVNQALMTGYRHYNLASERMRESILCPGALELEPLLASALLLVPFATASQQINYWISSRTDTHESHKLLSTTPRDVIIILRGIRTTLQTLADSSPNPNLELFLDTDLTTDGPSELPEINGPSAAKAPSRTHFMFPILTTTNQQAFSKLQTRLDLALIYHSDSPDESLSACGAAFDLLKDIVRKAFSTSNLSSTLSRDPETSFSPEPFSHLQVAPWLRCFASRTAMPLPTEPLTRSFLTFLVNAPQAYLDLVLPLLDRRLERPTGASSDKDSTNLTRIQALALDIYAHWSVFMLLVEEESWWIGNLPTVTLAGMMHRYGDQFVTRLWPEKDTGKEQWWPGSMLNILLEVRRYR